jgi:flavin-dependent dehydrogenase
MFAVYLWNDPAGALGTEKRDPKRMKQISIVGGGPAGSMCGERLARAGFDVTIFEERPAWEKPCGGGLTRKAIERYPFLLENPLAKREVRTAEIISSDRSGESQRVQFDIGRPIVIYSRKVLNTLLLERAAAAGCRVVESRVASVDTRGERVRLTARGVQHNIDFVVLAGGARNQLLPDTTPLRPQDLEMTVGYFIPAEQDVLKIKFLPQFEGYLWSFPRADHLSVGICGKMAKYSSQTLRHRLEQFVSEEGLSTPGAQFFGHVLPAPEAHTIQHRRVVGKNWALAGDAAACTDPITGEGLYYALRSGDLLAEALIQEMPEAYSAQLWSEFSADLEFAARIARVLFRGQFLGAAVTTRMVQFLRRSATFRELVRDVFSGSQSYRTLKGRLWSQLGGTLAEIARSLFEPPAALAENPSSGSPK